MQKTLLLKPYKKIKSDESDYFDILRGGSALVVFIHHIFLFIWAPYFNDIFTEGFIHKANETVALWSVMIFFVLSGFMITSSIYRNTANLNFTQFNSHKYVTDRLYRLYPPLLYSIFIVILCYWLINGLQIGVHESHQIVDEIYRPMLEARLDSLDIFTNALFLQYLDSSIPRLHMNQPLWSLSFEFWYYLLALLLSLSLIGNYKILFSILFLSALAFLSNASNAFVFACGAIVWFSGSFLAILYQTELINTRIFRLVASLGLVSLFVLALISYASAEGSILYLVRYYIVGLLFTCYIGLRFSFSQIKIKKRKRYSFLIKSAKYSYTLYIIHWPLILLYYSIFHTYFHDSIWTRLAVSFLIFFTILKLADLSSTYFENRKKIENTFKGVISIFVNKKTI